MIQGINHTFASPKRGVLIALFAVIIFDRMLKSYFLYFSGKLFSFFSGFLSFHFVENPGIAFSIYLQSSILVAVVSAAIVFLIIYLKKALQKKDYHSALGIIAILFGAFSNFYDRIRYGFVIDYIDVKYFTVFNLSDALITAGILYIFFFELRRNGEKPS